ncbi:hypothetical protein FDP41_005391 [Naegleria fowleri]|uniref:UDP-N-acetylglucosamine transferase subunit ALG13 n=1 Tax=Naegleria fowleri TaxID=5763 RepID=A0A6A5BEB8_NAEFO|nr:uncharacterized protein FDP41_005391 [Naegleria fowleri]KAF0975397.1 hypothetical protein FDP41_005391 [Naegleria fowleri]CAG4708866.1 unnamed protein product [Naegleria fowleri]
MPRVFVTVGTTQFNDLIKIMSKPSVFRALHDHGYSHLIMQIGTGEEPEINDESIPLGMKVEFFRKKDSIQNDVQQADLIISHAGSGSLFESLRMGKKIIAVPNESLMDNHQTELANALGQDGNVISARIHNLEQLIVEQGDELFTQRLQQLKPMKKANTKAFADVVDEEMMN